MKVTLYMASTINGLIARTDQSTPWSDEEWESYTKKVSETGNIIIGNSTYEIMRKNDEFSKIGNPFVIIVTRKDTTEKSSNFSFVKSPTEAIELLKSKGFIKALLAGGAELNSSFLEQKLINEIYIDIEPFIFGKGIPLFGTNDHEAKLELIESKQLSKNTLQIHYKVI